MPFEIGSSRIQCQVRPFGSWCNSCKSCSWPHSLTCCTGQSSFACKKTRSFLPVLPIHFSPGILLPEDQPAKELQPLGKAARKAMNRRLGIWDVFLYSTTRFKHTSFAIKFQRLRRDKEEAEYALEGCGKWLELKNRSGKTSSLDQVLVEFHCSCLCTIDAFCQCFVMSWHWMELTSLLFVCSEASVAL